MVSVHRKLLFPMTAAVFLRENLHNGNPNGFNEKPELFVHENPMVFCAVYRKSLIFYGPSFSCIGNQ